MADTPTEAIANAILERHCPEKRGNQRVIAAITEALASAPQEPDEKVPSVPIFEGNRVVGHRLTEPLITTSAQEPDDDAEWLRNILPRSIVTGTKHEVLHRLERIANRLQAKAPETPYCGIVVMPGDEAPETAKAKCAHSKTKMINYDPAMHDGEIVCADCGAHVRWWDAG